MVRPRKKLSQNDEENPMEGTSNLVDAMLVIAVGLLIFLTMSWNMQDVVFGNMTQEEKQNTMEAMANISEIEQGQEVENNITTSNGTGTGYVELGSVYKDPSTGKLIMVEK